MITQRTYMHGVILACFCLGFGIVLAVTKTYTKADITARGVDDLQSSLTQVIPHAIYDNNLATDLVVLKDDKGQEVKVYRARKGDQVTGVAYEITGTGYGGKITLILGVDAGGKILGVRALEYKETPGLGDKINAAKSDWITRFTGLSLGNPPKEAWKVKKDGGQFDQFSGATITPRGVVAAIRGGLEFFTAHKSELLEVR